MNTHLANLYLQKQSDFIDEEQNFSAFLTDFQVLSEKYGYLLAEYEAMSLPANNYPIANCARCGYLTLANNLSSSELENDMLKPHDRILHQGIFVAGRLICNGCQSFLNTKK